MKLTPAKLAPAWIALGVIVLICFLRWLPNPFERLEWMTYDMRVRLAARYAPPAATNLGFAYISDQTIDEVSAGLLGKPYGLYWPRHIYGRLLRELDAQGADAVAFDVIFAERRLDQDPVPLAIAQSPEAIEFLSALHPDQPPVTYENDGEPMLLMESDDYFAWHLRRSANAILAADHGVRPNPLFATNAAAIADISASRDPDGVLRRVKAFQLYRKWHPLFETVESDPEFGVDLRKVTLEPGYIVLHRQELEAIRVPIDSDNQFELSDFLGDQIPPGWPKTARAFTEERVWHMGVVLAARALNLDLDNAEVDLRKGRITFPGPDRSQRTLAVDRQGFFYINWELPYDDPRITKEAVDSLLLQDMARSAGQTNGLSRQWENKLVIVGSRTVGNDLTDRGATPLESDTLLASKHWNVANSLLTGRFVRRSSLATDLFLIALMGTLAASITWRVRVLLASAMVALLLVAYLSLGVALYLQYRYWLPIAAPVAGALLLTHVALVTWRVVFEQAEQRRIKSIFSTVVSPKIMVELLKAEKLSLGGARREITVLFADVRGFTELTDTSQERAAELVRSRQLAGEAAEACFDEQARQTLDAVNLYLGLVAETIVQHDATLDKFIGDCVMAFWGAPVPHPRHAVQCVRAVIEVQRAVHHLNQQRTAENKRLELENLARASAGLAPKPLLPILLLGSGINTGIATAGLMGSQAGTVVRQGNYTVFGREVNLASRLETLSGRGRILISEATHRHLLRDDPQLAATCVALPVPQKLKGISTAVTVYEIPWRPPGTGSLDEEIFSASLSDPAATTGFIQRENA